MLKAYRYRIYPTSAQKEQIEQTFGVCRLVYNLGLRIKIDAYKQHGRSVSAYDLINMLPDFKVGFPWVGDVNSQALTASLLNMDSAYKSFFNGGGFPKFKNRHGGQSFQFSTNKREVDFINSTITLPKLRNIPAVLHEKFEGKIKTVTISRVPSGKYFASVLVDNGIELPQRAPVDPSKSIGIDMGLTHFAILSDGTKYENNRFLKSAMRRVKVLNKRASRKKLGSKNRAKANKRLAIAHERVANQRKDYLQKLSTKIVCDSQATTICVEDLSVKNMVKNHKLAQAISDVSWSEFIRQIEYKCDWYGKNFVKIDRFEPSSKRCSCCGEINQNLTLADREWTCENCGTKHDRDINSAVNIEKEGLKILARRGTSEEPAESRTKVRAKYKKKQENTKERANYV